MKNRKLRLVANVSGFDTLIAEVKIQNFASEIDVKDWTDLVCPVCGGKPTWKGGYECKGHTGEELPRVFSHWSQLKRVIRGTTKALTIKRLLADKEEAVAKLSWLTFDEYAQKYVDATRKDNGEKGVVLTDPASAKNLFKLLVAVEQLKYVIVAKWNDTEEEIIALLTVSASGRIVLKEVIPANLAEVKQTLFIDRTAITEKDTAEAKQFINAFIPKATEDTFNVTDYRAQWKEGQNAVFAQQPEPDRVKDIKDIMAQVLTVAQSKPKKTRKK